MTTPPFEFGQKVWIARASACSSKIVPCPVCCGHLSIVVILGDGERVPAECEFCRSGIDGPRGTVDAYGPSSEVRPATVTGLGRYGDRWDVHCDGGGPEREVFATESEAEARRSVLHEEAKKTAQENFERRFKNSRGKYSWTVGYHRSCLQDLRRQVEWHESKLRADKRPGCSGGGDAAARGPE